MTACMLPQLCLQLCLQAEMADGGAVASLVRLLREAQADGQYAAAAALFNMSAAAPAARAAMAAAGAVRPLVALLSAESWQDTLPSFWLVLSADQPADQPFHRIHALRSQLTMCETCSDVDHDPCDDIGEYLPG